MPHGNYFNRLLFTEIINFVVCNHHFFYCDYKLCESLLNILSVLLTFLNVVLLVSFNFVVSYVQYVLVNRTSVCFGIYKRRLPVFYVFSAFSVFPFLPILALKPVPAQTPEYTELP